MMTWHELTWSIYYAERPTFRQCRKCGLLERMNAITLTYMDKETWKDYCDREGRPYHAGSDDFYKTLDEVFTIPKNSRRYPDAEGKTTLESEGVRKMYGQA